MWYDKQPLLSYNKIINMVLSDRGGGKTFHFTRWAIDDFKKNGKQTVWVRRYDTELEEMYKDEKFFKAVRPYYPNDELKVEGNVGLVNGKIAIYFIPLSTSRDKQKSANYPDVNKIVYDEFIKHKGRTTYLPDEVETLLDLYESVDRMRDETRMVLLANRITITNPYFVYFGIKLNRDKRFTVKGQICVEVFTDADYIEAKSKTRFGQAIKGTKYGDYLFGGTKFLDDNDTFIAEKTPISRFQLCLKYAGKMYGFWADYEGGYMYVNRQFDPYSKNQYCLTRDDHSPNLLMIRNLKDSRALQMIIYCFQNGMLRFSDAEVKQVCYEIMGLFIR